MAIYCFSYLFIVAFLTYVLEKNFIFIFCRTIMKLSPWVSYYWKTFHTDILKRVSTTVNARQLTRELLKS